MREVLEHQLVVGRIAYIHPAVHFCIEIPAPQLAHDPPRTFELVVRAKPAIDVDAAHRGIHARRPHDAHRLVNALLGQVRELAVVDGDVRLAPRRVGGTAGAGHLALDLCKHFLHAGVVALAGGLVLLVALDQPLAGQ